MYVLNVEVSGKHFELKWDLQKSVRKSSSFVLFSMILEASLAHFGPIFEHVGAILGGILETS